MRVSMARATTATTMRVRMNACVRACARAHRASARATLAGPWGYRGTTPKTRPRLHRVRIRCGARVTGTRTRLQRDSCAHT